MEPALAHEDSFLLLILLSKGVPLRIGVSDQLSDILIVAGIEDIEEIFAVRKTALRQLVGEVLQEISTGLHLRPQALHADFIKVRNVNKPHIAYLQEFLLLGQDLSKEIFIEHGVVWQIELHYTGVRRCQTVSEEKRKQVLTLFSEVLDEVMLAVELALEF